MKKDRSFAEGTTVSVAKSKTEIDTMLTQHGATSIGMLVNETSAMICFEMQCRRIKMVLPMPSPNDPAFAKDGRGTRTPEQRETACEAERRRRWRALSLVLKAKLESVHSGIERFEEAFLAHILAPDGQTVGDVAIPQLARAYKEGVSMPLLLGVGSK